MREGDWGPPSIGIQLGAGAITLYVFAMGGIFSTKVQSKDQS